MISEAMIDFNLNFSFKLFYNIIGQLKKVETFHGNDQKF